MIRREKSPFSLILLGVFTIYIHILPINVETFPVVLSLIVLCTVILSFVKRENYCLYRDELAALLLLFIILAYGIITILVDGISAIIEVFKYLLGPLFYLFFRRMRPVIEYKPIRNTLVFLFILTLAVISGISPVIEIIKIFIPRFEAILNFRGISVLTPEPSYFSFFAMFSLITARYLYTKKKCSNQQYWFLLIIIIILSAFTFSVYVYMTIFLFFFAILFSKNKLFGIIPLSIILIAVFVSDKLPYNRISQMLISTKNLLTGNISVNSFLYTYETSGTTRIILNLLAFTTVFIKPLGTGFASLSLNALPNAAVLGINLRQHPVIAPQLGNSVMYAQTYFANIVNDMGVFSFLYLYMVFSNNKKEKGSVYFIALFFVLFMTFFQGQITNPVLWYLIVMLKKEDHVL